MLKALLVADAEALFFVNDHKPKVLEVHVRLDQPVRADDDIHGTREERAHDGPLLL